MFENELNLLKDYNINEKIDPISHAYLHSFISHVE